MTKEETIGALRQTGLSATEAADLIDLYAWFVGRRARDEARPVLDECSTLYPPWLCDAPLIFTAALGDFIRSRI